MVPSRENKHGKTGDNDDNNATVKSHLDKRINKFDGTELRGNQGRMENCTFMEKSVYY